MEEIQTALVAAAGAILLAIIKQLTSNVIKYLDEKGITETLQRKQYLVDIAVNATQQIWKNEDGATKLAKAKTAAVELLNKNNVPITEIELDHLIEAAVKAMNIQAQPITLEAEAITIDTQPATLEEEK